MFSVDTYLAKLGYTGRRDATLDTLRELHKRHLITIPFDNGAHSKRGTEVLNAVDIDVDTTFDSIVMAHERGGVCFELSGLFRRLLQDLGFDVVVLSAGVRGASDEFGPDLEHLFLGVRLDGANWLVDVGFAGPSFLEPLRLGPGIQSQYGCDYRIEEQDGYHVLSRRPRGADWQAVYRLRWQPRSFTEWTATGRAPSNEDDPGWNWAGQMVAAGTVIRGRSFDNGQMVLVGRRYVRVEDGRDQVRVLIDNTEFSSVVDEILAR